MKYRYLPATVMLSAGAVTIFMCLYNGYETLYSLKILLAVLIIFLIIGSLTRRALLKIISMGVTGKKEAEVKNEESEEENEEEKPEEATDNKNDNV